MAKKYTVSEADIQHYVPPELSGRIAGMREDRVRPQTVEEIEALQKQAYDEASEQGYAKGYEEGHQKGYEEMQIEAEAFREKARELESVINFLSQPLKQLDRDVEHQLADLAVTLSKYLLRKESSLDAQHIHALVHESLDYLPVKARDIRVRLHPDDIALLNQAEIDIKDQSWSCIADTSMTPGGCMVESDTSHIDSTVETRLQQLVEQLETHQHAEGDEDVSE